MGCMFFSSVIFHYHRFGHNLSSPKKTTPLRKIGKQFQANDRRKPMLTALSLHCTINCREIWIFSLTTIYLERFQPQHSCSTRLKLITWQYCRIRHFLAFERMMNCNILKLLLLQTTMALVHEPALVVEIKFPLFFSVFLIIFDHKSIISWIFMARGAHRKPSCPRPW